MAGSNKNNVGFTAIIFICTGAATVLQGTKVRPTLFYAVKRFSRAKPTLQKWACQFWSYIHARQAIWPIHLIFNRHLSPAVIPAQAGIQSSTIQNYLEIIVISNFWIPAYAGMTARGFLI